VIVQLLRESTRQPGEPADGHANREVLTLHLAGAYAARVGPSIAYLDYRFYHWRRRVTTRSIVLSVIAVELYHLREIGLSSEDFLDSVAVEHEAINCELKAVLSVHVVTQSRKHGVRLGPSPSL
jgi:hypothetical protein